MPSAVELLQAKRVKEGDTIQDPASVVEQEIAEIDEKLTKKKVTTKIEETPDSDDSSDEQDVIADDDASDSDSGEDDLDEQQLKEARNLYKTLRSGNDQARGLIADLANRMGLPLAQVTTKTEVKEVKKAITDRLKEALGTELGFLAEKIGPVLEQAIAEERQGVAEIQNILEVQQLTRESETTLNKLAKETNGLSRKYEAKMVQLMDRFPASTDISTEEYIRGIAQIAMGDKLVQRATNKAVQTMVRNSKNAPERLAGKGTGVQEEAKTQVPDKKLGIKGAVAFALGQLSDNRMPTARNRK
jgi:hypothetical protein